MRVVFTATTKTPSKDESRRTSAWYIVPGGGIFFIQGIYESSDSDASEIEAEN
jgi:hypothetical protein